MKISMPANYDPDLIPQLNPFPVTEVYGKFPSDLVGGGRPSYMGTPLSRADLQNYVRTVQDNDMSFNYLLNSSCLGNREWTSRWQKKLMRFLDRLTDMGIRRLTVSTPFLLEIIKERRPDFYVKVGIYAKIDTPARARFWQELGADELTLESLTINRNFRRLKSIRNAVDVPLQLITNHICMPNCPLQSYHQNGFAHASDNSRNMFIDYCLFRCNRRRMEDPSLFIRSPWIRPEDLETYERMGYDRFKLTERGIPSNELLKRVRAHAERCFTGNLAELLIPYGFEEPVEKSTFWFLKHFLRPTKIWPWKLKPILELARHQGMMFPAGERPVVIKTDAIPDDFLERVAAQNCEETLCEDCGYCNSIAEKAVLIDESFREESLRRYRNVEDKLRGGDTWNV
ncbi:MAG: U32 family peptidase [Candidatus Brocadiia bacterium]